MNKIKHLLLILFVLINITACTTTPPSNIENICSIFRQYPDWYWSAKKVRERWGVPISTLMAIIYQESRFNATAKPPRKKLLWIIPWLRPTSAYGYSQAINSTWHNYKKNSGGTLSSRDAFADAADFIGWYANQAHIRTGISKKDTEAVYLAFHEGIGGYSRRTHLQKSWLLKVAKKVQYRSWVYHSQLARCQASLPTKPWWRVW